MDLDEYLLVGSMKILGRISVRNIIDPAMTPRAPVLVSMAGSSQRDNLSILLKSQYVA